MKNLNLSKEIINVAYGKEDPPPKPPPKPIPTPTGRH